MQSKMLHKMTSYPRHIHNFYGSQLPSLHMATLSNIITKSLL